jgi:hypothetical protein
MAMTDSGSGDNVATMVDAIELVATADNSNNDRIATERPWWVSQKGKSAPNYDINESTRTLDARYPCVTNDRQDIKGDLTHLSDARRRELWESTTRVIKGCDKAHLYRCDWYGNVVCWNGEAPLLAAWRIVHVFPWQRGGLSRLDNLACVQWQAANMKERVSHHVDNSQRVKYYQCGMSEGQFAWLTNSDGGDNDPLAHARQTLWACYFPRHGSDTSERCAVCDTVEPKFMCLCERVDYCSVECQQRDWTRHRDKCLDARARCTGKV